MKRLDAALLGAALGIIITWTSVSVAQVAIQHMNGGSPDSNGNLTTTIPNADLSGTTGSIGGGLLTLGSCATGSATVAGAAVGMSATSSPTTYPGDGSQWQTYVSSANTVTVKVCALVALTPVASVYNVRVIP